MENDPIMNVLKEIVTPMQGKKVVIKTMLTGAERERVTNAPMKYAKTEDGSTFTVTDMEKVALAEKHALLETSVIKIDDDGNNVLERLLKMYEADYEFVYNSILTDQKKMRASISPTS